MFDRPRPKTVAVLITVALVACSGTTDRASSPDTAPTATTTATTTTAPPTTTTTTTAPPTTTTAPPTTTTDPGDLADAYSEAGPHPIGVTTVSIANGIQVEIWYPAAAGTAGTDTYDVRDFTAPAVKAILTADVPATYTTAATRDAPVADGTFPVVLNSHGFSGIRVGSSFLTSHLASWGMIVVSPDHPTRDLYHAVAQLPPDVVTEPADDLLAALDMIIARSTTPGDPFAGHVDAGRVGALGHSAGGATVVQAALDDRIDGYVSMASGLLGDVDPAALPAKPSFFLAGALDHVVEPGLTRVAFETVPEPTLLWSIDGVGHNGFDDFCTFGDGRGIIGIAEASGLGPFLDTMPQFRVLGEDGCVPPAAPVATTFPIVRHAVTAWFNALFGIDPSPQGLGPEVADRYGQPVAIDVR
jgi:dienelactone hydrolase